MTMINSGDFVTITNPELAKDGIELGSTVYVAALKAFPLEEDGYTQRIKFFVHKTTDELIDIKAGLFVIDPASVVRLSDAEQVLLVNQYAPKDEVIN